MSDSIADLMEPVPGEPPRKPKGDLGMRTVSAVVMVMVAGAAFWYGGSALTLFITLVGLGVYWEFFGLIRKITSKLGPRIFFLIAGAVYVGLACYTLFSTSEGFFAPLALILIGAVIATDVGAYFVGRNIGGPKIAPAISPSKTWSGLLGGMLAAGLFAVFIEPIFSPATFTELKWGRFAGGALIAIIAQAGDFLESWMKRKAAVKDSGSLIPGHGGLFDRTDGLIAAAFVAGVAITLTFGLGF
jgi:phosphatidate cytidylyltransferase